MAPYSTVSSPIWRWLPLLLWSAFGALLVLLHLRAGSSTGFSQPLSAFSVGPDSTLYRAAFLLASGAPLALALADSRSRTDRLTLAMLVASSLGSFLAALAPSDGERLATTVDRLHALGMATWLASCTLLVLLRGPGLARFGSASALALRITASLLLLAVVAAKWLHAPELGLLQRLLVTLLLAALLPLFARRPSAS
jgi:hypothetical protein